MKLIYTVVFTLAFLGFKSQNIGISSTGAIPDPSAMLDVTSTTKGLLIPRMTSVQRAAIPAPLKGLIVFDNTTSSIWFYDGTVWLETSTGNGIYDGDGTTPAGTDVSITDNINFDANTLFISGTNNRIGIGTNSPTRLLDVVGVGDKIRVASYSSAALNDGTGINFVRARGTEALPTLVSAGDQIAFIGAFGHDGASAFAAARIDFEIDGAPGLNDMPGLISFRTTLDNTTGAVERMIIKNDGKIGVGTSDPTTNFEVREDGAGATWRARSSSSNSTADRQVFLGTYNGNASIASHNFALNAWEDLFVNTIDGTTGANVLIGGNIGLGTAGPSAKLDVVGTTELNGAVAIIDGTQGANKVLTSDASGNATWQSRVRMDYGVSLIDPVTPVPSNGDMYYNSTINQEMRYDVIRSKWLSVATLSDCAGRGGITAAGSFYRMIDGVSMSATSGYFVPQGTVVGVSFTTATAAAHTVEVLLDGVVVASAASGGATTFSDMTLDGDFGSGILSFRNSAGSLSTMNAQIKIFYKLRP